MRCKWQKLKVIVLVAFCIVFCKTTAEAATVLPANVTEPLEGCVFVGLEGSFIADADAVLNRINEIRYEACKEGIMHPNGKRALTLADYIPIKWSYDLEYIARIRAAEAGINIAHTRPNGQRCFTVKSPGGQQSYGEVLAWNQTESATYGINQWYEEKEDWIKMTAGKETGHYTQMIDPNNTYVGMATFYSEEMPYPNSTCGEFSSRMPTKETKIQGIKDCIQTIEVPIKDLSFSIYTNKKNVKQGEKAEFVAEYNYLCKKIPNRYVRVNELKGFKWTSSNPSVATIDENGIATAVGYGAATIKAVSKSCSELSSYTTFTPEFPQVKINKTNFPGLYKTLKSKYYDLNKDGYLSKKECEKITWLQSDKAVSSLKGIEYFPYLSEIRLTNYTGTTLTIPKDKAIRDLWVDSQRSKIVINAPKLKSLTITKFKVGVKKGNFYASAGNATASKKLKTIDVSKCKSLHDLNVIQDRVTSLKLPKKNKIRWICLEKLDIKSLNLKECPKLAYIRLADLKNVKSLDLRKNSDIRGLELYRNKKLAKIDASKCKKIKEIYLYYNKSGLKKHIKLPKGKKVKYPKNNRSITKISNKYYYEK